MSFLEAILLGAVEGLTEFLPISSTGVMLCADRRASQERGEKYVTRRDTLSIGAAQCLALIPGVSRSGATVSAGLLRGIDRVTATKLAFFLSIPALTGAGALQTVTKYDEIADGVGWGRPSLPPS